MGTVKERYLPSQTTNDLSRAAFRLICCGQSNRFLQYHKIPVETLTHPLPWLFLVWTGGIPPYGEHHRVLRLGQEHLLGRNWGVMFGCNVINVVKA